MKMHNEDDHPDGCPVGATMGVIEGKWKVVILYYLLERIRRFSELKRLMPGVTQRMLTLQLRELEQCGIINRKVYPQIPPKVEYSITNYGKTLEPVVRVISEWGWKHLERLGRDVKATPKRKKAVTNRVTLAEEATSVTSRPR
ncbi:MAG TPA: helix-turn-helix domain-containing protein [Nitrospira sp.]|nr:helix-turn-helix domain-containing protein [Nitrospira sp.]